MAEYESDAVAIIRLLEEDVGGPEERVVESISVIEETMDWYDHIAAAFLLYEDPGLARGKIGELQASYRADPVNWSRQFVISPLFQKTDKEHLQQPEMWKKLLEVLYLLHQYRLLNFLDVTIHEISNLNPLRCKLFRIMDGLSEEEAQGIVDKMNSKLANKSTDASWCREMHFLKWIETGEISEFLRLLEPPPIPDIVKPPSDNKLVKSGTSSLEKFQISRGRCIIINQMRFYIDTNLPPHIQQCSKEGLAFRYGSDVDRAKLSETFRMLGHEVEIYENLNRLQLQDTISKIAQSDFTNYDALVVCILSHGERGCVYSTDSIPISLESIKNKFNAQLCPTLMRKPKLFFLQACQGVENQKQVPLPDPQDYESDGPTLPAISNFFEAWATVPGFLSYRSTINGAVFINELCKVLQNSGHAHSLFDLVAQVNNQVSQWENKEGGKQIGNTTHCLTRGVQFKRPDEKKFIDAVVDRMEREMIKDAICLAAHKIQIMKMSSVHAASRK